MRLLLFFCFISTLTAQKLDPKGFLRARFTQSTEVSTYYIAVEPDPKLRPDAKPEDIKLTLFGSSKVLPATPAKGADATSAPFTVEVTDQQELLASYKDLNLFLASYPIVAGTATSPVPVALEVSAGFEDNLLCKSGMMLAIGTPYKKELGNDYTHSRSKTIMEAIMRNPRLDVLIQKTGEPAATTIRIVLEERLNNGEQEFSCVKFEKELKPGKYRMKLDLNAQLKKTDGTPQQFVELTTQVTGEKEISTAAAVPNSIDSGDIGNRSLERNLDLGIQFTSAVKDAGTPPVRGRTNQGTFDVRIAPLLNLLPNPIDEKIFLYFTPLFVDARVSTGKITEDNLSMNRINIGTDFEMRKYRNNANAYSNVFRMVIGARNTSDRDFHQAEFKGVVEIKPIIGKLNHPTTGLKPKRVDYNFKLDDNDKSKNEIPPTRWFGWQVLPVVGTEFGRIYRNHNRAATVLADENVRRLYVGGTVTLNFTKFVTASGENLLYVRGEAKDDRLHNYLKVGLQFSIPSFTRQAAHGMFLSYERGNQPPFATPDVNAVKVGYRLQWDEWFNKWR